MEKLDLTVTRRIISTKGELVSLVNEIIKIENSLTLSDLIGEAKSLCEAVENLYTNLMKLNDSLSYDKLRNIAIVAYKESSLYRLSLSKRKNFVENYLGVDIYFNTEGTKKYHSGWRGVVEFNSLLELKQQIWISNGLYNKENNIPYPNK